MLIVSTDAEFHVAGDGLVRQPPSLAILISIAPNNCCSCIPCKPYSSSRPSSS